MQPITKITFVVVGALAAVTGAQDVSTFPSCAQWCISSMQQANKSQELSCTAGDNGCLCRNPNFTYGVRDCSAELCANTTTAEMALGYVNNFCRENGVQLSTVTSSGLPPSFTGAPNATVSGGAGGAPVPISTVDFTSTITTDGSTITTTGASTLFSTPSGSVSPVASASELVSTIVSEGSTFLSTLTSPMETASGTSGATDAAGTDTAEQTSSTTSEGFAAQMTAAPAGMLAIAGVAALLL